MTVEFGLRFDEPVATADTHEVKGGVRVEANGNEITSFEDEEEWNEDLHERFGDKPFWYEHPGEPRESEPMDYYGKFLSSTLRALFEAVQTVGIAKYSRSGDVTTELKTEWPGDHYIVFSDITEDSVRISFEERSSRDDVPIPTEQARRGEVVTRGALYQGAIEAFEKYREYLQQVHDHERLDGHGSVRESMQHEMRRTDGRLERLRELG